jgi:hypothetical protein
MKYLLIALLLIATPAISSDRNQWASYHATKFPTNPGEYIYKQWKYIYIIKNKGTRSEQRIGKLFLDGKEVKREKGELLQEYLGFFMYFGDIGFNQGWLNTMTYDTPVFVDDKFELTPDTKKITDSFSRAKAQQDAAANP